LNESQKFNESQFPKRIWWWRGRFGGKFEGQPPFMEMAVHGSRHVILGSHCIGDLSRVVADVCAFTAPLYLFVRACCNRLNFHCWFIV
jgi:hypothetical protein